MGSIVKSVKEDILLYTIIQGHKYNCKYISSINTSIIVNVCVLKS